MWRLQPGHQAPDFPPVPFVAEQRPGLSRGCTGRDICPSSPAATGTGSCCCSPKPFQHICKQGAFTSSICCSHRSRARCSTPGAAGRLVAVTGCWFKCWSQQTQGLSLVLLVVKRSLLGNSWAAPVSGKFLLFLPVMSLLCLPSLASAWLWVSDPKPLPLPTPTALTPGKSFCWG